jgi:2-methylcitrate dehydratase PrpD
MQETAELARYAATCRYEDIPPDVVERAKQCITDTVAAVVFGYDLPWSRMIVSFAEKNGAGGNSRVLGPGAARLHAPAAALANGALAHAFEMDNLTWPNTGVHPGATLLASGLALAQERGRAGRDLILAVVAGAEVMIRIGRATQHSNEGRGFHAPGTTGPFGAAVACSKLMDFDTERMQNALGIAGSLACGLLEFARAGNGAMVKRLHLGRAAESGVPCHITAHTSVQAILDLRAQHRYGAGDVAAIRIAGNDKMARVNNIASPADIMMAQYSIPFCVALAHVRDPRDPRSFDESALRDAQIRSLAERVTITIAEHRPTPLAADVTVTLKDGRVLRRCVADFKGTPEQPLDRAELREKFLMLTRHCPPDHMGDMFDRLQNLEHESDLDWIGVGKP